MTSAANDGPSDAAVLRPLELQIEGEGSYRGLALGCGICPGYGRLDPYAMAWAAIDEALRNVVAAGADPDRVALLDNFCWGNPNLPDRLGDLVRAAQGCHDAALHYGTPFVSGKDSLNNEYVDADRVKTPIPPTLLISALAFLPDVRRAVSMDVKGAGSRLYLLGETRDELGGSALAAAYGLPRGRPPAASNASATTTPASSWTWASASGRSRCPWTTTATATSTSSWPATTARRAGWRWPRPRWPLRAGSG